MKASRVPRGTRGLKLHSENHSFFAEGRVPRGTRGLKRCDVGRDGIIVGRVPRGTRGLKQTEKFVWPELEVASLAGRVD